MRGRWASVEEETEHVVELEVVIGSWGSKLPTLFFGQAPASCGVIGQIGEARVACVCGPDPWGLPPQTVPLPSHAPQKASVLDEVLATLIRPGAETGYPAGTCAGGARYLLACPQLATCQPPASLQASKHLAGMQL